jgi:ATP-dependent DNA helicase RecQ
MIAVNEITQVLQTHFGYSSLKPGQGKVVSHVLDGVNTLAVLPTGGGKSLCYQLPALMKEGLSIVVSPLIALMRDQVDTLTKKGIVAVRLDSSSSQEEQTVTLDQIQLGEIKLLYLSPERLVDPVMVKLLQSQKISLVAIDEAHCVSEWGHSFRPAYLRLSKVVKKLKPEVILALTATASPGVAREIRKAFGILKRDHVQTSFYRENLHFHVTACEDREKNDALLAALTDSSRLPAIVYATRRETVETLATMLRDHGMKARAYHAGMVSDARSEVQDGFVNGTIQVICATIAFGMGIDMAGVRAVIHYQPPKSPEGWIQESGRAGRDGLVSHCELLVSGNDRSMLESFLVAQKPTQQAVMNVLNKLFSQGKRSVISSYDLSTFNDIPREMLSILLTRLEMQGWIVAEQGSWLWCHAVPLVSIDRILIGFKPAQQKILRPILASRKRVSLMELSGGTVAGQMKLMGLLAELNAAGDVKMKFSHRLLHFRVRQEPEDVENLAGLMHDVFEQHVQSGVDRIDAVMAVATSRKCIIASLLAHFGEKLDQPCCSCSSCLGEKRLRKLPKTVVPDVTQDELELIQAIASERKPALASPERLARFLCGIYSPGMMRYRLYQRTHWGLLKRLPYDEVLAYTTAQMY